MEIFLLYNSFFTVSVMFGLTLSDAHFWAVIIGAGVWLGLFVLQGFGLWKMASKRGMKRKWLAFVPFGNYLYMSKLAGACNVFGQKLRNAGLFVMIAQIVASVFCALLIAAVSYLFIVEGEPVSDEYGVPYWGGSGFSQTAESFYHVGAGYNPFGISILSIVQLVYEILLLILTMGLYKKYAPKGYSWLALLGLFLPMSRYVVVFCLRNRDAIDYEAYMRARREEFARQYQQRYGGFGPGGFGTPYGGYGNTNPYGQQNNAGQTQKPEEPFGEFGGDKNEEKPNGNDDGFFH
ncbi:MAG: hypothetical protein IJ329_04625 [Clostridia bacterium]|nr:hypothetical protein [Clostridia bacterium]